ncbi:hypothetical protein [Pseudarthrobacter sp. YAF2]|uniref:hypothetical protein n=1 Tax=Pseudarthrobacter sp. YAF2 TaxID=3233078 RepID=UPI003F9B9FA8
MTRELAVRAELGKDVARSWSEEREHRRRLALIQAEGVVIKTKIRAIGSVIDEAIQYPDNATVQWLARRYLPKN